VAFLCPLFARQQCRGRSVLKPYRKVALSFADQLRLLEARGLTVPDRTLALRQLSSISYYRLSAYWYPFLKRNLQGKVTGSFETGTNFSQVVQLYEFDRHLRLLVIDAIERVEVHIRTLVTYHLGHQYGPFGHIQPVNFHPNFDHAKWLTKLEGEALQSKDAFVEHFKSKYTGFPTLPIWMSTEVMSLGSLSFCYTGLKNQDKQHISRQLGIHHKRLKDWLHTLTYVRNICAHHSRLWNRELAIKPEKVRDPAWNSPITPRHDRLFYVLLILRVLLRSNHNGNQWAESCNDLLDTFASEERYRTAMGMPSDWKSHPLWI
jgi:abortive infection bacteriophage resistance protein